MAGSTRSAAATLVNGPPHVRNKGKGSSRIASEMIAEAAGDVTAPNVSAPESTEGRSCKFMTFISCITSWEPASAVRPAGKPALSLGSTADNVINVTRVLALSHWCASAISPSGSPAKSLSTMTRAAVRWTIDTKGEAVVDVEHAAAASAPPSSIRREQ